MVYDCIPEFANSTRWFDEIKLGSAKLWDNEFRNLTFKYWQKFHEGKVEKNDILYEWIEKYDQQTTYFMPGQAFEAVRDYYGNAYSYRYDDYYYYDE